MLSPVAALSSQKTVSKAYDMGGKLPGHYDMGGNVSGHYDAQPSDAGLHVSCSFGTESDVHL